MNTKRPSVLFVCTGNICRSPMAAALFQARLKDEQPDGQSWQIDSAGTWATAGEPVSRNSALAMAERGWDISRHKARTVTARMLAGYDLILTMEPGHKEALQIEFPEVAERVFLLSEMEGKTEPVDDPYGGTLVEYQQAARVIDQMIQNGMPRILELVEAAIVNDRQSGEKRGLKP